MRDESDKPKHLSGISKKELSNRKNQKARKMETSKFTKICKIANE